jgi:hypothetical protein
MTTRLYLRAVTVGDGTPSPEAIAVERFFVNASEPSEVWVETEAQTSPEPGRAGSFTLSQNMELGFRNIFGTVERKIQK